MNVLYVDADVSFCDLVKSVIEREYGNVTVTTATEIPSALDELERGDADCLVTEAQVADHSGLKLIESLRSQGVELPLFVFTTQPTSEFITRAKSAGATDVVSKGGIESYERLADRLQTAVQTYRANTESTESDSDELGIFEDVSDPIVVFDTNWRIQHLNHPAETLFNLPSEELRDERLRDIFPGVSELPLHDRYSEAVRTGESQTGEVYFGPFDSWVRQHLFPIDDGIICIFQELEDRTESDGTRENDAFHEALISFVEEVIVVLDSDHYITYAASSVTNVLGFAPDDLVGRHPVTLVAPDDRDDARDFFAGFADADDQHQSIELRVRDDGGSLVWLEWQLHDTEDEPSIDGPVLTARDVTQRKVRELEMEAVEDRFKAYVENASDIISVVDADGIIRYQSPAVEEVLGYGQRELIGDAIFTYIHNDDQSSIRTLMDDVLDDEESDTARAEYRFEAADGDWVWLESIGSRIGYTDTGGFVVISRDVSDRKDWLSRV